MRTGYAQRPATNPPGFPRGGGPFRYAAHLRLGPLPGRGECYCGLAASAYNGGHGYAVGPVDSVAELAAVFSARRRPDKADRHTERFVRLLNASLSGGPAVPAKNPIAAAAVLVPVWTWPAMPSACATAT